MATLIATSGPDVFPCQARVLWTIHILEKLTYQGLSHILLLAFIIR